MTSPAFFRDEFLAFLRAREGVNTLYRVRLSGPEYHPERVLQPADGGDTEENLSHEEKLRRERTRQLAVGITSFAVLPDGGFLLPQHGSVCRIRPGSDSVDVVVDKEHTGASGPCLDLQPWPYVTPGGNVVGDAEGRQFVAFVQENEVYVASLTTEPVVEASATGAARMRCCQVTHGAREIGISNGVADYLAAEEFDRYTGMWWAPDGSAIAFQNTDDRHIPEFRIIHVGADPASSTEDEVHRYPFAGAANPRVRLGVVHVGCLTQSRTDGFEDAARPALPTVWCNLGDNDDIYLARVCWSRKGRLVAQLLNRAQTCLDLVEFDATTGDGRLLLREETPTGWINVHDVFTPVRLFGDDADHFIWASERDGFQHLYLYAFPSHAVGVAPQAYAGVPRTTSVSGADGATGGAAQLRAVLTRGEWVVEGLSTTRVDRSAGDATCTLHVYAYGTLDSPLQRHLYDIKVEIKMDGAVHVAPPAKLTSGAGMHSTTVSDSCRFVADELSTLHTAPSLCLFEDAGNGAVEHFTEVADISRAAPVEGGATEELTAAAAQASGAYEDTQGVVRLEGRGDVAHALDVRAITSAIVNFEDSGKYTSSDRLRLLCVCHGQLPPGGSVPDGHVLMMEALRTCEALRSPGSRASAITGALHRIVGPVVKPVTAASAALLGSVSTAVASGMDVLTSGMDSMTNAVSTGMAPLRKIPGALRGGSASREDSDKLDEGHGGDDAIIRDDVGTFLHSPPAPTIAGHRDADVTPTAAMLTSLGGDETSASAAAAAAASTPAASVPPKTSVHELAQGQPIAPLIITIPVGGGHEMYGALFIPDVAKHGPGPYKTVISVYGGPHVQRVRHFWPTTMDARAQALRNAGFLVAVFDNRGSSRRGCAFERALRHRMGTVEVADQVAGATWLIRVGLAQPGIGIYGHSYGGYMTLMCMARAPEVLTVGVAGAPVTDWAGYDTAYTERYMSTPQDNPDGYRDGCVMSHVSGIRGKLLLVHGLIDENVHARHSYRLIQALNANDVDYKFIAYPSERHGIRSPRERAHMESATVAFFKQHVGKVPYPHEHASS